MIKGYIFDMDGTLIDSMGMICRLDEDILVRLGIGRREDLLTAMRYIPLGESAQYVKDHSNVEYTAAEIMKIMVDTVTEGYLTIDTKPMVREYLDFCRGQGIPMMIATATEPDIAREVAGRLGLLDYMQGMVSCTDVGKSKEHPDVFLESARIMGLPPEECAVFEDGVPGAISAGKAGFAVVGVYDANASAEDSARLREVSDRYITSFADIENTLI